MAVESVPVAEATQGTLRQVATDRIGGFDYQIIKVTYGADGTATEVTTDAPLPARDPALTAVAHNKVTVVTAGTRVQFGAQAAENVIVKAARTNNGVMYLGGSAVAASNGFELDPGDAVILPVSNTNLLYVDSSASGDYLTWLVVD